MSPSAPTFEAIMARLDQVVATLEGPDVELERALALFEEGMGLTKAGSARLLAAERRLEVLLADGQAEPLGEDTAAKPQQPCPPSTP